MPPNNPQPKSKPAQPKRMKPKRMKPVTESESGVVSHVVIRDPASHRELLELCAKWHRASANSMYVDWEQSLSSYRIEQGVEIREVPAARKRKKRNQ